MTPRVAHRRHPFDHPLRVGRTGVTMIETIVSAVLLITLISFFTTMVYRVDGLWRDTAQHRAAMMELSNQLEPLTLLSAEQARRQLDSLQPSATVTSRLENPVLEAEIVEDEWGSRVVLELNWQRRHPGTPLRLVGWLRPQQTTRPGEDGGQSDEADTAEPQENAS